MIRSRTHHGNKPPSRKAKRRTSPRAHHGHVGQHQQQPQQRAFTSSSSPPTQHDIPQRRAPTHHKGSIEIFMGPMFSGKTTHLLSRYKTLIEAGTGKPLLIKHSSDERYHGKQHVVSHTNIREEAVAVHYLADPAIAAQVEESTHIFIDEGQFFPDLNPVADDFARAGKKVYIAALDGTFKREPFPSVAAIIPKVDVINKLNSICHTCGDVAPFSKRLTTEEEVHVIGGKDKYQAACRSCYDVWGLNMEMIIHQADLMMIILFLCDGECHFNNPNVDGKDLLQAQ